jgi:hypothetical protein
MRGRCWWISSSKSGSARGSGDCFNFKPIILFPRPVRKFSASKFLRCLKTAADNYGLARKTAWPLTDKMENFHDARRPFRKHRQRHCGGHQWKFLDRHGKHGLDFFKDGKFFPIEKSENGLPGDDISCLYLGQRRRFVGWHFGPRAGAISKWKMDALFDRRTDLPATASATSSKTTTVIYGSARTRDLMRIQKKSLNDFAGGTTNVISCRTYGNPTGCPRANVPSGSQPAACRAPTAGFGFPPPKVWCL